MISYGRQWIDEDDCEAVLSVLKGDWLTQGPAVEQFEKAIADYCGTKFAVAFNSGTSALHGAYYAAGLSNGDEFITSPNTFLATANAGLYLGAIPVFCDIETDTGNIDVDKVEALITEKTRLLVPVHFGGHPADMVKLKEIAQRHSLMVIEDACHALGSKYYGHRTGGCYYSDMAVFSFHPVKHITTGEGGAVLTNDDNLYEKMLMFRTHGVTKKDFTKEPDGPWSYEMHLLGYNYRLTDIQAALGIAQMKKLDLFIEKRRKIAGIYNDVFKDCHFFQIPPEREHTFSSYHLFPIRLFEGFISSKKEIFRKMREKGLGIQVHYKPVYTQPYYEALGYKHDLCPNSETFYRSEISIPIYPRMGDSDVEYIVNNIQDVFKEL